MTFSDDFLKLLKQRPENIGGDFIVNVLPSLLARLEAAERGYSAQCKKHGCIEECEAHRKAAWQMREDFGESPGREEEPMTDQELNEAVARKLGKEPFHCPDCEKYPIPHECRICGHQGISDYCHSIEAAWDIVESLKPQHGIVLTQHLQSDRWSCQMWTAMTEEPDFTIHADTAPMAIVLAFLKVGDK